MRKTAFLVLVGIAAIMPAFARPKTSPQGDRDSLVIIFKDGHQQAIPLSDIARVEFKTVPTASVPAAPAPAAEESPARASFLGKWKVGEGAGVIFDNFFITLKRNGEALKSIGASHGTWTVVDGEARIAWDDGWHDAIRKVGKAFEKVAFEPGHDFSSKPNNVTKAEKIESEPI